MSGFRLAFNRMAMNQKEIYLALQGALSKEDIISLVKSMHSLAVDGDTVAAKVYLQCIRIATEYAESQDSVELDRIKTMIQEAARKKRSTGNIVPINGGSLPLN